MGNFLMRPEDELMHQPDASSNFNESVYTNGFNTASPVGGWMRLGNRVNEGYAELSVCLYLPDGRIACQFQRPAIEQQRPLRCRRHRLFGDRAAEESVDGLRRRADHRRRSRSVARAAGAVCDGPAVARPRQLDA